MTEARPNIPEPIKRAVRRRCGFSCIFCGEMVVDYEHIEPYSEVLCHEEENIVLLCTKHHREVTSGRKSKDSVREAAKSPYSFRGLKGSRYLFEAEEGFFAEIGGKRHRVSDGAEFSLLAVNNESVLSVRLEDGVPLYSFCFADPRQASAVKILDNQFVVNPDGAYDCRLSGRGLKVYGLDRKKILDVSLEQSQMKFKKMSFMHDRVAFRFEESFVGVSFGGKSLGIFSDVGFEVNVGAGQKAALYHFVSGVGFQSDFDFSGIEIRFETVGEVDRSAINRFFQSRAKSLTAFSSIDDNALTR